MLESLTFLADIKSERRVFQILGLWYGRRDHFALCYSFEKVDRVCFLSLSDPDLASW